MSLRHYLSFGHLQSSLLFAQRSAEIEAAHAGPSPGSAEHRYVSMYAVIAAAAFLEAVANEVLQDAKDGQGYGLQLDSHNRAALAEYVDHDDTRARTLEKFQMVLLLCRRQAFDKGASPYQEVHLVLQLRNELVHSRPKTAAWGDPEKLRERLEGKFPLNPLMKGMGNPFFPDHCLGSGCARWAHDSSLAFAKDFHDRLGTTFQRPT